VKTVSAAVALVVLSFGSAAALAADFGIGVSIQSDDSIIYVPIDVNKQFRLEPSLRYLKDEQSFGATEIEQESIELGLGLFGLAPIGESIRVYYGGRLAYVKNDFEQTNLIGGGVIFLSAGDSDGYRISPTLGFEYLINERLSIGAEAEYFFQDLEGDSSNPVDADSETSGTDTRLIVRFKF
jgi:hypothetical protein